MGRNGKAVRGSRGPGNIHPGRQPREFAEIEKNLKKYWFEGLTLPRAMPKMRATCSEQRTAKNAAGSQG